MTATRLPPKKNKFTQVGTLLPKILESYRYRSGSEIIDIWRIWDFALDSTWIEHATPWALRDGILIVQVTSPVWSHHLHYSKPEIIRILNQALGQALVRDIRFKVGSLGVDEKAER